MPRQFRAAFPAGCDHDGRGHTFAGILPMLTTAGLEYTVAVGALGTSTRPLPGW